MMAEDRIQHPHPAELERFLLGDLPGRDTARVLSHLLKGCGLCSQQMKPLASVLLRPDLVPDAPVEVGPEYDFPLFKAFAAGRRYAASLSQERHERERDQADAPLHEVPAPTPLDPIVRGLRDWERCEQLLARCQELRRSNPPMTVATASLAVCLAERISPDVRGPQALSDLQAMALAERGNARRVADDLVHAEADLARALNRASEGTESPGLLARLLDLTASLRIDQRRFDEALKLLDWVHYLYLEMGERHEAGRALISKSNAASYSLDLQEAIRLLGLGLMLIETERDPHLVLAVVHNLAYHLIDEERVEEARGLMRESRPLYAAYGGQVDQLKARWLEGRIAMRLSDPQEAEQAFQEVRTGFADVGVTYDIALVSLELAEIWLDQGRTREIQDLLDDTVNVFRARGIRREAITTLLMLRESVERQSVTTALLRATAATLEQLCNEPPRRRVG
jgi:tetratricopeptide (TPR) repeat protein